MNGTYVGIDLSLTSTGIAIITNGEVSLRRVQSKGARDDNLNTRHQRLKGILQRILEPAADADLIGIEGPSLGQTRQSGVHDRSGLWWRAVGWLLDAGYPVIEVPPACRAKYATGKGNASKDTVLAAVCRRYPDVEVTGNDVADALLVAAIAARLSGEPIEASMPALNLTALDKLTVPTELARAGAR